MKRMKRDGIDAEVEITSDVLAKIDGVYYEICPISRNIEPETTIEGILKLKQKHKGDERCPLCHGEWIVKVGDLGNCKIIDKWCNNERREDDMPF